MDAGFALPRDADQRSAFQAVCAGSALELDAETLRTPVDVRRTRQGSSHHAPAPPPRPTPVPPPPPRTSARRSGPRCAAPVRRGVQSPGDTHGRERRSPAGTRGAPRRARRDSTRRHGWEHGINDRDLFFPEATATCTRPTSPAPATCTCRRTSYCDMYPAGRSRSSDMYAPEDLLLRHVTRQPTPLQRHVAPAGRPTATCDPSADTAPATCASRRTCYCEM